jgi:hypothetical protein
MTEQHPLLDLGSLDPGTGDPDYWDRFSEVTLERARPQLQARAWSRRPSLGLQLVSWGRALAPMAALAAALAGILLVSQPGPEERLAVGPVLEIEDILNQELMRRGLPVHYQRGAKVGLEVFVMGVERGHRGEW